MAIAACGLLAGRAQTVATCPSGCWTTPALSNAQLADLVVRHFPDGVVPQTGFGIRQTAYAVARAESNGNPTACGDGCTSFGPWQVHIPAWPQYTAEQLFDPEFSAAVSFSPISREGLDWNPWCTWEPTACGGVGNNRYRAFLAEAAAALADLEPPIEPPPPAVAELTGVVTAVGGSPIPGALVTVFPERRRALAGVAGEYIVAELVPGEHQITVEATGFQPVSFAFALEPGVTVLNISLLQLVFPPPPVVVPPPVGVPPAVTITGSVPLLLAAAVAAVTVVALSGVGARPVVVKKLPPPRVPLEVL